MQLGVDFGTTHTVVSLADRGNYPVVSFVTEAGDAQQWYPALVGVCSDQIAYGLDAQERQHEEGWVFARSLKRLLATHGPESLIRIGDRQLPLLELLTEYLSHLRRDLHERSNLEISVRDEMEVFIASPANANSNQRFLTMEGFRRAGFRILGMINEPSAAGIEFAERFAGRGLTGRKVFLVVYDLGGGTFDASVIGMKDQQHEVITDEGISELGGDDFDELLLELALHEAGGIGTLTGPARFQLLEECRRQKEALHPNKRRITIDLGRAIDGAGEVVVPVEEFYKSCVPLIQKTVEAMEGAMARAFRLSGVDWSEVAAIYLAGGSSDLPVVARMLRERHGRRVRRSPFPYSATAIGLAIAADVERSQVLHERFTRFFGVWREGESGHQVVFDPIFLKDTLLPEPSGAPMERVRSYHPVHNIGHYRFLECSRLTPDGQPDGDIIPWSEILFGLDSSLSAAAHLKESEVRRASHPARDLIRESYACDSHGIIKVTLANTTAGYERTYNLKPSKRLAVSPRRGERRRA
jgi:molecular chaperone DnaK